MKPFLSKQRERAILTVRMDSPETRNALTDPSQMQEFVDLCAMVRADRSIKVVILTGNGTAFCAGGNVKDMRDRGESLRVRPTMFVIVTATAFNVSRFPCMSLTSR